MDNIKEIIAKTIVESLEQDFLEKKYELDLDSHNNLGMLKSDVINTNLKKNFNSERYIVHKFKRYAWEGRFIIDLTTKSLISITSNSNLKHLPKVKGRRKPHYMQTLLYCLNDEIKSNQQMYFEGFKEFDSKVYKEDFGKILNGINFDLDDFTYYVVTYSFEFNKVKDMTFYLLGPDFNIAEKTNMMKYIKPDFVNLTISQETFYQKDRLKEKQKPPRRGIKLGLKEEILKKEG